MAPERPGDVARFFDEEQAGQRYRNLKALTRAQDLAAADRLNREVEGDVLCIGGLWEHFSRGPAVRRVTVLDLSPRMLETYGAGVEAVVGDLYACELPSGGFDSVVFALVLHHVAQGGWRECRARIHDALARAARWLRPGGRAWILEYCPARPWMPLQRAALPFTRAFLRRVGQPLVVMHDAPFYARALEQAGFRDASAERIQPPSFDEWAWFPVFMATPWLRIPVKLYPKMHLFRATRR